MSDTPTPTVADLARSLDYAHAQCAEIDTINKRLQVNLEDLKRPRRPDEPRFTHEQVAVRERELRDQAAQTAQPYHDKGAHAVRSVLSLQPGFTREAFLAREPIAPVEQARIDALSRTSLNKFEGIFEEAVALNRLGFANAVVREAVFRASQQIGTGGADGKTAERDLATRLEQRLEAIDIPLARDAAQMFKRAVAAERQLELALRNLRHPTTPEQRLMLHRLQEAAQAA